MLHVHRELDLHRLGHGPGAELQDIVHYVRKRDHVVLYDTVERQALESAVRRILRKVSVRCHYGEDALHALRPLVGLRDIQLDQVVDVSERVELHVRVQRVERHLRRAPAVHGADGDLWFCRAETEAVALVHYGLAQTVRKHSDPVLRGAAPDGIVIQGPGDSRDVREPVFAVVRSGDLLQDHRHLLLLHGMARALEVFTRDLEVGRCPDGLHRLLQVRKTLLHSPLVGDHAGLVHTRERLVMAVLQER